VRVRLWRTTKASIFLLAHGKGRNVPFSPGAVSCFFLPCVVKNARQRFFTVRCQTRRTAKGLYHAKCYRVPFAVRLDEKRTTKSLPCFFWTFAVRPRRKPTVSRSGYYTVEHTYMLVMCIYSVSQKKE
jgi:hypothetical protein